MDSKLHSGNKTELLATAAVETERKVEAEAAPEKEAEPVADHPTVTTELALASETTIPEKLHSTMDSKLHSGTPETETESEIPATVVEVASEKEVKAVADRPTVTPVDCVFRVIVPVFKVESIIGRNGNGDLINKMCEETKANIRVLKDPVWHPSRVVLISGKEEIEAPLSPAMDAVIRVFKHVNGFPENESDGLASIPFCSIRLLVPSMQATGLIGKQGSSINTIQENIGCSVRILSSDEVSTLSVNSDDRVVDLHGEGLKVLQVLEAVLGHLRVLPLVEKTVTQRMPISIRKAVDIIGVGGTNIADIGRTSGAILTVQETKGLHNEIAVVMKGTSSQVKAASQLLRIQVKTINDWDRPAVLNKPTSHPRDGTTAATETPVEPQKEPTVCSSLLQVPQSRHRPMSHVTTAPSGMESIKEPKRNKIRWNVNVVKTFLDACIREIPINGRDGGSLKAMSWQKVGETLKASHDFSVDDKQMKNYFNGLKGKYRAWVSLKNKTGNKYDPSTNTFNLSDKEWETEMKEKSMIGLLRNSPLSFPDLCAQLFDGTISMGIKGCGPGSAKPTPETEIQTDTMSLLSPSSSNPPVKNKQKMGEASLKPQAAVPFAPSSATTETTVEPQKEPMVCSSLVEVPPELPQVQPANAYVAVETKAEVPTEWPEVQLMAMGEAEVPAELPQVQPAIETKADVPSELPEVQLIEIETEAELSVELGQVQFLIETKAELPTKLPEVQPSNALEAILIKAEVPTELPEVQPANALEAIETKLEEPVVPVSTDDLKVADEPMEMQVEEYVVLTELDQAFSGPDHTAPGFSRTGIDQALTGPSLDQSHLYKDLPAPYRRGRTLSPPPHVTAAPAGMESIKEPKRYRYHWNHDIVETFLDACIHESAINGQEGGSLKAMSWKKVGEMLKATHNFSVDSKQMKNYFDGLKSKYRAWVSLKHKTANKYDPSTNMFNLTDKEWETEIKENKCIEELRKAPLRFPDLCAQLFDGGIRSWGLSFAEHISETKIQTETMSSASPSSYNSPIKNKQFSSHGFSCFGLDPGLSTKCPPGSDRTAGPFLTQAKTVRDGASADRTTPSSPLLGFAFASSSSSKPFSVPSPTFGFGLFGSSSSSSGTSLFCSSSTFGASSSSAVSLPFSSGLFGSSSPTTTKTASKTLPFPAFGVNSSYSTTTATESVPIFANSDSTGTSSSFLGFQTSSKTLTATAPLSQPQSTPASSYCVMESIKESEQNKRKKCHHNVAGVPLGLELQAAVSLIPPSTPPLPATEAPVEPQKEPMVEVPQELSQVQPATASVAIETKRTMSVFEEEILGVLKMIADKMNKPKPPPKPTFEDCEKKLNELGWPKDDPLHEVAFAIFCDQNDKYRECWMKLHPKRCANWVRMIGRSKNFL